MRRGQDRLKEYQALARGSRSSTWTRVQSPAQAQAYDVRGPCPILVVERGRQAREDHQRLRAGHHERAHQGHPRRQEDGLLRGGRGRALRRTAATAASPRAKAALAQEPVRDEERPAAAREEGPRRLHRARGGGPGEGPAAAGGGRDPRLREGRRQGAGHGRARDRRSRTRTSTPCSRSGTSRSARTWWWTSRAWASSSGRASSRPIAAEYPYHEITKDFRLMTVFHMARSVQAGKGTRRGRHRPEPASRPRPSPGRRRTSRSRARSSSTRSKDQQGPDLARRAVATVSASRAPAAPPSPSPSPGGRRSRPRPPGRAGWPCSATPTSRATRSSASRATRTSS